MKLFFQRGKTIVAADVVSITDDDLVIEYNQSNYHLSPDLIGKLIFTTPYGLPAIGQSVDYIDSVPYDQLKLFFPEMGDASRFKFESYHYD